MTSVFALGRPASLWLLLACAAAAFSACDAPNPNQNSPTSGRLVVFVDEIYAPLFSALADTFMQRSANAKLEIRPMPARSAMQSLFDEYARDTNRTDTSVAYAVIVGRSMLADEKDAIAKAGIENKEYVLGYDGLAVVVPANDPLRHGTLEGLRRALASSAPTAAMLDSTAAPAPVRFLLPDQNSSAYSFVLGRLRGDSTIAAPASYFADGDSVLDAVAAGKGIGLLGWYPAHRDSARTRTLWLGFIDSTGAAHPPARVHVTSLVTDAYPIKLPLVGYTFGSNRSLAVGFLAWLARSQDAQYYLANHGLQPENVKIRIVIPER